MSAIAGVVYPELFPVTYAIEPALEALGERSPEEPTTFAHKNVELGIRGGTIGFSHNRSIAALVDGHLDQSDELITKLRRAGLSVPHTTPSHLIVYAYEAWGEDFLSYLHGTIAFALFDLKQHELWLARDRLGVRPLYWAYHNRYFLFGSELKALLATGLVPQSPSSDGIAAYLSLGFIPQDLTALEHINKLLPGHTLRLGSDKPLSVTPYWSYSSCFTPPLDRWNVQEELSSCLKKSMTPALDGDPIAYYASGNLGAAYLADQIAASPSGPQATGLILHFPKQNEEEVAVAKAVADQLNLRQVTMTITPQSLADHLPDVVWRLDEPIASPMACALWGFYEQAPEYANRVLSTVGTSAILSAHRPIKASLVRKEQKYHPGAKWLLKLLRWGQPKWVYRKLYEETSDPWVAAYLKRHSLFDTRTLKRLSPVSHRYHPQIYLQRFYQLAHLGEGPDSQMYLDVKTSLCDRDILPHDRLSSQHGLQWCSPYLDENVVTYMAQLPDEAKAPLVGERHPLHQLLRPELSHLPFCRPAWRSPLFLNAWTHDAGLQRMWALLLDGSLVESGWVSRRWLEHALQHGSQSGVTFQQLWSLLVLEVWFQQFINRPVEARRPTLTTRELFR